MATVFSCSSVYYIEDKIRQQRGCDRRHYDGGQKGGRQSDFDRCGTEQVFRQGNYAEGNEGPDHQAAGRLEGSAEGT